MAILVFSQNVKLESLEKFSILNDNNNIIITPHFLFENEREFINKLFPNAKFYTFADFLTDEEMSAVDIMSYVLASNDYQKNLNNIRRYKNKIVINKVLNRFKTINQYILSDDLGIDETEWKKFGFKRLKGEYYYTAKNKKVNIKMLLKKIKPLKKVYDIFRSKRQKCMYNPEEISVGYYKGHKYVFIGKMNRIGYRFDIEFNQSQEECDRLNKGEYEEKDKCTYLTTWHEHWKCHVPDDLKYSVRWAQDGYLPPNYSHKDYQFKPNNVVYYCWDELGTGLFKNQELPYELIPFRKKIFLPEPKFQETIKNILIVASGSGDWTALKNRSDDDIMVDAFVNMAKKFPDINFTYRCHPTWVHPQNVGVNSINRVSEYFEWLKLPNLKLSSNIPNMKTKEGYQFSFSRSSLEEDLENADFVFGEHSISMIDAGFKKIPFCSVNITKRRNFFIGINNLGFPVCTSHKEIEDMIKSSTGKDFKEKYLEAIKNYNEMTKI